MLLTDLPLALLRRQYKSVKSVKKTKVYDRIDGKSDKSYYSIRGNLYAFPFHQNVSSFFFFVQNCCCLPRMVRFAKAIVTGNISIILLLFCIYYCVLMHFIVGLHLFHDSFLQSIDKMNSVSFSHHISMHIVLILVVHYVHVHCVD